MCGSAVCVRVTEETQEMEGEGGRPRQREEIKKKKVELKSIFGGPGSNQSIT